MHIFDEEKDNNVTVTEFISLASYIVIHFKFLTVNNFSFTLCCLDLRTVLFGAGPILLFSL